MVPIPINDNPTRVVRFAVPETFTLVVKTFGVVKALETKTFPWTYRLAPVGEGVVLIPNEVNPTRVVRFVVPATFTLVVKMLEAVNAFEAKAFPTIYNLGPEAVGNVPIPMFEVATRVRRLEVPATFTLVVKMLDTVSALETNTFP